MGRSERARTGRLPGVASKIIFATIAGLLICAIVPILAGVALFAAFGLSATTTVYQTAISPDDRHEARVQFSDCGAACSFQRDVFVKSRRPPFGSCYAFGVHGEWPLRLEWLNPSTLVIHNPAPADELRQMATSCGSVKIQVER